MAIPVDVNECDALPEALRSGVVARIRDECALMHVPPDSVDWDALRWPPEIPILGVSSSQKSLESPRDAVRALALGASLVDFRDSIPQLIGYIAGIICDTHDGILRLSPSLHQRIALEHDFFDESDLNSSNNYEIPPEVAVQIDQHYLVFGKLLAVCLRNNIKIPPLHLSRTILTVLAGFLQQRVSDEQLVVFYLLENHNGPETAEWEVLLRRAVLWYLGPGHLDEMHPSLLHRFDLITKAAALHRLLGGLPVFRIAERLQG